MSMDKLQLICLFYNLINFTKRNNNHNISDSSLLTHF